MSFSAGSLHDEFSFSRERIARNLAAHLRAAMATLVCNMENADLLLVAADGKKLPAHECILRARAPGFYQRHVEATISAMDRQRPEPGQLREVAIGDIDSAGLEFFIHSVYTEDEIALFPIDGVSPEEDRRDSQSRNSQQSFQMDDSTTDAEEFRCEEEETSRRDHSTPTQTPSQPPGHNAAMQPPPLLSQPLQQLPPHAALARHSSQPISASPQMTSFRDLATASPMSSVYSLGGRSEIGPDIPEEEEDTARWEEAAHSQIASMSKFIRLDSIDSSSEVERTRSSSSCSKAIFPLFIGLGDGDDDSARTVVPEGIRGRALMAKRLSVASLTSLTSIDMSSSMEVSVPLADKQPSCRLASDLLRMYTQGIDTDVVVRTQNGDLFAHKCILSALSPFFRQQLKKSPKIEMKGYSKSTVNFLLSFLYGGLTSIPEEVDIWEIVSLATHLNLKDLCDVVILHLKMTKCHFFHRPCATCVSAVFDALPQLHSIRCLRPLFDEAMVWQARHFCRVWKGRVFLHLAERWQRESSDAVIAYMDDETVIDIILGCERLQTSLPRCKSESSQLVQGQVNDILDMALLFLTHSFHLVVTSKAFATQGKGLALNVGMLEELLPPLLHSLSADVAIKSFLGLRQLRESFSSRAPLASPDRTPLTSEECSPRYLQLVQRLHELLDKHLLHFAASVVRAEAWSLLPPEDQTRIQETGIFVEMRQPKMPPPRLSSFYRTYKRSASAGVQPSPAFTRERNQSIERGRPLSSIQPSAVVDEGPREESIAVPLQTPPPETAVVLEESAEQKVDKEMEKEKEKKPEAATIASPKRQQNSTTTHLAKREGRKSPVKKKAIETEEGRLERQVTHTIMTTSDAIKEVAASLPGPSSPKKATAEKPKSVVKPMLHEPPLAGQKTLPRITAAGSRETAAKPAVGASSKSTAAAPLRSSIPRKAPLAGSAAANASVSSAKSDAMVKRRPMDSSAASKSPRSPKNARKEDLKRQN